jgi:hypothetical protein
MSSRLIYMVCLEIVDFATQVLALGSQGPSAGDVSDTCQKIQTHEPNDLREHRVPTKPLSITKHSIYFDT